MAGNSGDVYAIPSGVGIWFGLQTALVNFGAAMSFPYTPVGARDRDRVHMWWRLAEMVWLTCGTLGRLCVSGVVVISLTAR
jgi:hypothetical protein